MIVIIDYGLGNLGSIHNMFKKLGVDALISAEHEVIKSADKLILPGVGSFDAGMKNLEEYRLVPVLNDRVLQNEAQILGICLGMQLLGNRSEEGTKPGFGWIDAQTVRFKFDSDQKKMKIPHMGWNTVDLYQPDSLFDGLESDNRFYFVHSYHVVCTHSSNVLAQTSYGINFTSALVKNNIMGVQFHPEKSHKFGMQLLKNFAERV
jgi:glutamine amidotransferase